MSKFTDRAKDIIATVAPTLGAALGGPLGGLAGNVIAKALGVDPATGDPDAAINAALAQSAPDTLLALRKAEQEFQVRLQELGIQKDQLEMQDRDSARKREVAVRDRTPAQLAWLLIGGFIGISFIQMLAVFIWGDAAQKIPDAGWLMLGNVSGYLANEAKQAAAYYFGSTSGSKDKDKTLSDIAKMP